MNYRAECTVDVKDGETLKEASYREVNEAIASLHAKYPEVKLSLGSWQFTDEVSLNEWRKGTS